MGRAWRLFQTGCLTSVLVFASFDAASAQTLSCPMTLTGDTIGQNGFYITNFPGNSLVSVQMAFGSTTPGNFVASLTAHAGAFDGPVIGTAQSGTITTTTSDTNAPGTFNFSGASVTPGTTVAFTHSVVSGTGTLFYSIGPGPLGDATFAGCPNFIETSDFTPPLSSFRRASVGATITYANAVPALRPEAAILIGLTLMTYAMWALRRRRAQA